MSRDTGSPGEGRVLSRRELLTLAGAAGVAGVAGAAGAVGVAALSGGDTALSGGGTAQAAGSLPASLASLACIARPAQTEGPYFVDARLEREDVRVDPVDGTVSDGVPLLLAVKVHRLGGTTCEPLPGAHVDIWQCDALGVYSDVLDTQGRFDTRGRMFLRGYQVTDRDGVARFTSIYPGWYAGRTPHIHFKIRLLDGDRTTHEFTSQLYFDDAVTDRVYALPPYAAKGPHGTRNPQDRIYRGGGTGAQLMLPVTEQDDGYAGTFEIGLLT